MKPPSAKPAPGHHRCFYRSAAGRQCRSWVIDPRGMFCPRHCAAKPNGPDDFAFHLLQRSCGFQNGEGIRDSPPRIFPSISVWSIASPRLRDRCWRRRIVSAASAPSAPQSWQITLATKAAPRASARGGKALNTGGDGGARPRSPVTKGTPKSRRSSPTQNQRKPTSAETRRWITEALEFGSTTGGLARPSLLGQRDAAYAETLSALRLELWSTLPS